MENTARDEWVMQVLEDPDKNHPVEARQECDVVPFKHEARERDSLSENFINEIDAWARHALASNGFGDY